MAKSVRAVLSDDQLSLLAAHGEERTTASGDFLYRVPEGEPGAGGTILLLAPTLPPRG